jgi:hypothetical protein
MNTIFSGTLRFALTLILTAVLGAATSASAQQRYERFAGYLRNSTGKTLGGGTVSVNSSTTTSEVDGYFEIYAPAAQSYLIRASMPGHVPYSDTHVGPGREQMDIRLLAAETFTVDPRQTINIADNRGTRIVIAPGSLVDAQGGVATGPLQLSLRTFDLNNEEMIGDMTAVNSQGQRVVLQSLGAFSAEFTDASGNLYNLAPGRTARITMPVDPANTYSGPVPLWYFNEALGYWVEEAMGQVSNGVATGEVPHFSAWNFDLQFTSSACTTLYIDPGVFTLRNPAQPWLGYNPVNMRFRVMQPGWPAVKDISVETPGPHILYALPTNTPVEVYLDGTAYTLYNSGAAWTGLSSPSNTLIPRDYSQCNSNVYVDNRTPKVATVRGTVTRQHRSNHAGILVTLMSGTLKLSATTDATGNFSLLTPSSPSTVSVTASRGGYLSARRTTVAVSAGATVILPSVALLAGDVSGDNCVDWSNDVQVIGNAMGTTVSSDDRRDVNGNFQIDFSDVNLASANGGLCGPRPW